MHVHSHCGLSTFSYPRKRPRTQSYGGLFAVGGVVWRIESWPRELDQVVELVVLGARQEGGELRLGVHEGRAVGEPRIAHRDLPVRKVRHLDARAVRVAELALLPRDVREIWGGHAVVGLSHAVFLPVTERGCYWTGEPSGRVG